MINHELVRLVNSQRLWAFVGSGVSADAGLPAWSSLLISCKAMLQSTRALTLQAEEDIAKFSSAGRQPQAFQVLVDFYGKEKVDEAVKSALSVGSSPGEVHNVIARWPFNAYITTNYECLLERALSNQQGFWLSVGNSAAETAKLSKDVSDVVWHPHGGICLDGGKNRLIIGTSDYDEIYPSGSPVLETLKTLLRMCRILFVGFSFSDPDFRTLLEKVARISIPGHPAYAFLADTNQEQRDKLRHEANVEVIPYDAPNGDHSALRKLLSSYNAFVITRDIRAGTDSLGEIEYDPSVTSLLVQNKIQARLLDVTPHVHETIMRATILSKLETGPAVPAALESEALCAFPTDGKRLLEVAIQQLEEKTLIVRQNSAYILTPEGQRLTSEGSAAAKLKRDQFVSSLLGRVDRIDEVNTENVSRIAADFFESICRDRGLGVAQNLVAADSSSIKHRTVSLLQSLPNWFPKCSTRAEIITLIEVVAAVLRSPTGAEREYLGMLTQAYFGCQLAKVDVESLDLRRQVLAETVFICDSHFLIQLLARGAVNHRSAMNLRELILDTQAKIVATELLVTETEEHARYALRLVEQYGDNSRAVLDVVRAAKGRRPNSFLQGYILEGGASSGNTFRAYLSEVFGKSVGDSNLLSLVTEVIGTVGIMIVPMRDWEGFSQELFGKAHAIEEQIRQRRIERHTMRHDRQVQAEAEIALLVTQIRAGHLRLDGHASVSAFFLSESRVVDDLDGLPRRLSIGPESLLQWLLSVRVVSAQHAKAIFDHLLYDLSESGHELVPRDKILQSFSGVIQISKDIIARVLSEHREVVYQLYGEDPSTAFADIDELEIPEVADQIRMDVLAELKRQRDREQIGRREAEKVARRATEKLDSLEKYRARREGKRMKAKKKKARAKSKKSGKGRGKK